MNKLSKFKFAILVSALLCSQSIASHHDEQVPFQALQFMTAPHPTALKPLARFPVEASMPSFNAQGKRERDERREPEQPETKLLAVYDESSSDDDDDLSDAEEDVTPVQQSRKRGPDSDLVQLDITKRLTATDGLKAIEVVDGLAILIANGDRTWAQGFFNKEDNSQAFEQIRGLIQRLHNRFPIKTLHEYKAFCYALTNVPVSRLMEISGGLQSLVGSRATLERGCHARIISALLIIHQDRFVEVRETLCEMLLADDYDGFSDHLLGIIHTLNRLPFETIAKLPIAIQQLKQERHFKTLKFIPQKRFFPHTTHFAWLHHAVERTKDILRFPIEGHPLDTDIENKDRDGDVKMTPADELMAMLERVEGLHIVDEPENDMGNRMYNDSLERRVIRRSNL